MIAAPSAMARTSLNVALEGSTIASMMAPCGAPCPTWARCASVSTPHLMPGAPPAFHSKKTLTAHPLRFGDSPCCPMNHPNSSVVISGHGAATVAPSSSNGALMMNPQTPLDARSMIASSMTDGRGGADASTASARASPSVTMLESGRQIASTAVRTDVAIMILPISPRTCRTGVDATASAAARRLPRLRDDGIVDKRPNQTSWLVWFRTGECSEVSALRHD